MESFKELAGLSIRERVRFGARAGARVGAYLAALTGVAAAVVGRGAPDALPPVPTAAAVFLGTLAGGVVFALGRPSVRDSCGAALLGAACVAPTLSAVPVAARGPGGLSWGAALALGLAALLFGGLLGVMAWRGWTRQARS